MTPYLILDEELVNSLIFAAQRGVDVKLILPHIPDKKYAYMLARTYYEQLIRQGVEIYEYIPGFVHAKVFTCDDERAVVGTINLDYRSYIFILNVRRTYGKILLSAILRWILIILSDNVRR